MSRDDQFYEALKTRDHRFDGKFFVGVKTTGIYCRPVCPAKPKRQNVEFFPNYLEAERAGYRPCLRCHPESAPQSAVWIGTSAVVKRAIKVLHTQDALVFDENEFASLFGISARHLRRLFQDEIGKTPKQLSFENRLNLARKLIVETALPFSEIAFASGYGSVRRFNDAFKDRFKKSPKAIRSARRAPAAGLKISLPYRPPFDYLGLLKSYETHRIGNLEWFADQKMYRIVHADGKSGVIAISNDAKNYKLVVEIDFPDTAVLFNVIHRVRTLFDLDSDPVLVANSLETDPATKQLLKKHPGIRLASGWDPFEIAIATILGQLVSVEMGRQLVSDLIEIAGENSGIEKDGKPIKLFPSPLQLMDANLKSLRTTEARKKTLVVFSQAIIDKKISLEPTQDVDAFLRKVRLIPGVGPWTANYMALKILRDADSFPATDLILARALKLHPQEQIQKMSPWRGYAAALFWREYAQSLKKSKKRVNQK